MLTKIILIPWSNKNTPSFLLRIFKKILYNYDYFENTQGINNLSNIVSFCLGTRSRFGIPRLSRGFIPASVSQCVGISVLHNVVYCWTRLSSKYTFFKRNIYYKLFIIYVHIVTFVLILQKMLFY
jgi:hypothetical protein